MDKAKARQTTSRVLDWIGNIWLILACLLIIIGYIAIVIIQGWSKLQDILSPFNIWNFLAVVITLAPGIGLKLLAKRIGKNNSSIKDTTLS